MKAMRLLSIAALLCSLAVFSSIGLSQSTISTGSIQGTVTDPNGAVVAGATVTITNKANGQVTKLNSNSVGSYATGALQPGDYNVRIENKGFRTEVLQVTVQVGVVALGNAKLAVGEATEVMEVTGTAV